MVTLPIPPPPSGRVFGVFWDVLGFVLGVDVDRCFHPTHHGEDEQSIFILDIFKIIYIYLYTKHIHIHIYIYIYI